MKTYIYIFTGILLLLITICPILYHIENKVFNPLQSQELRKIFLSSLRLYVNANNLFTFSNAIDGRNPEAMNAGYSEYPLLRTFSFGISIKL